MFAVAASWSIVFIYLYYNMITPVRRISHTMQIIRQTNNYNKHLVYKNNDDLGMLVNECNELLKHVSQHTEKLSSYSYEDALTGIGNRRYFQEQLEFHQRVAKRKNMTLSAIVFDLDYFKQYNDTYGHDAGDKVLQGFAKILDNTFTRDIDVVARTGGEEFIVLLLDNEQAQVIEFANRVVASFFNQNIPHSNSAIADRVTVSAGVASAEVNEQNTAETVIIQADNALYRAKHQGRNQVSQ
jgi:diguanylate cyclase (GGDEF)-like protein